MYKYNGCNAHDMLMYSNSSVTATQSSISMESLIHDAGMNGTRVDISIMAQLKQMNAIIHDLHIVSQVSTTINHMVSQIQVTIYMLMSAFIHSSPTVRTCQ